MSPLLINERGISPIVGLIIVIGVIIPLWMTAYLREVPPQQREAEFKLAQAVKLDFLNMKDSIQQLEVGETRGVQIHLGTESTTPMLNNPLPGTLTTTLSRYVSQTDPTDDAYVDNANPTTNFGGENFLLVSPTRGLEKRTYLKFDLTDVYKLYDSYNNEYEEDVQVREARLWLYCENLDLKPEPTQELQVQVPVTVEVRAIENDSWTEGGITWNNAPDPTNARILDNETIDGDDEWYSWDVSNYVRDLHEELIENQVREFSLNDNLLSFVLMEPRSRGSSSLNRLATFTSEDNSEYNPYDHPPSDWQDIVYLEIIFSRGKRMDYTPDGLVDTGWIEYKPSDTAPATASYRYPNTHYIFEGGAIIQQQYGWYGIMISEPDDFIRVAPGPGNTIYVTVTRYRVTTEASTSGTGITSASVSMTGDYYLTRSGGYPNYDEATITVRTDHPRPWREYFERLAAKLNYEIGGEWNTYGDWVDYNYNRISLKINGPDLERGTNDIYYNEIIKEVHVDLGGGY